MSDLLSLFSSLPSLFFSPTNLFQCCFFHSFFQQSKLIQALSDKPKSASVSFLPAFGGIANKPGSPPTSKPGSSDQSNGISGSPPNSLSSAYFQVRNIKKLKKIVLYIIFLFPHILFVFLFPHILFIFLFPHILFIFQVVPPRVGLGIGHMSPRSLVRSAKEVNPTLDLQKTVVKLQAGIRGALGRIKVNISFAPHPHDDFVLCFLCCHYLFIFIYVFCLLS